MAVAEGVGTNTSVVAVFSELDNIHSLIEEQRAALMALLDGKEVLSLLLTGFSIHYKSNECDRQIVHPTIFQVFFKQPALSKCYRWVISQMGMLNKFYGYVKYYI